MCGIAGIIGKTVNKKELQQMLIAQQYRGPDFTGVWKG